MSETNIFSFLISRHLSPVCQDFPAQMKTNWRNTCVFVPHIQGEKPLLILKLLHESEKKLLHSIHFNIMNTFSVRLS